MPTSVRELHAQMLRDRPGLQPRIFDSAYESNQQMVRLGVEDRWCDLAVIHGVWCAVPFDRDEEGETGHVPIAHTSESTGEVVAQFNDFLDDWFARNDEAVGVSTGNLYRASSSAIPASTARPALVPGLVAAALLLIAVLPLDYGFYVFLRIAITALAIWMVVVANRAGQLGWALFAIAAALIFNPIIPVYNTRAFWAPVDVLGAVVFACAAWWVRPARGT